MRHNLTWNENLSVLQDNEFHIQAIVKELNYLFINDSPDCLFRKHHNPRISKNNMECNDIITFLNEIILPQFKKKQKYSVKILISRIILDCYLSTNNYCRTSEFLNKKIIGMSDYIKLMFALPIIKFLKNSELKGRSYFVKYLIRLLNIDFYFSYKYENIKQYFPKKVKSSVIENLQKNPRDVLVNFRIPE